MAYLAIKGHATRGREVIEILEMLGGKNTNRLSGNVNDYVCIINHPYDNIIENYYAVSNVYKVFTLEEFLEKFPYKVGDKVRLDKWPCTIAKMYWNGDSIIYYVKGADFSKGVYATDLQPYKEETMEEKINEGMENLLEDISYNGKIVFNEALPDKTELVLGDNYEIKVEDGKTYVVRKIPKYPKNYKECCDALGLCTMDNDAQGYKGMLIIRFQELLIARDAYWKIAGEQMGLGKPWKPNFVNEDKKFILACYYDKIYDAYATNYNRVLVFPTEEMRDAFFDNFKELIEECKELL